MEKTVGVVSLGCSKNRIDTEQMLGLLAQEGYRIVSDPAEADILIVNTCGFIASAKEESIDAILEMAAYKQTGRCQALVVTGCLSQRYGEDLAREMPEVDALLGVGHYAELPALLRSLPGARPLPLLSRCAGFLEAPRVLTTPAFSAYVKIGDGCDNRCSYCAIPDIRGGYRSRPQAAILAECESLVRQGVKELTLVAQDTTRYGTDAGNGVSRLPQLLREIADRAGARWLRVLYCYPARVEEGLLDALASSEVICPYLDVPIQHIVPRLLTAMHRHGTADHIRWVVREAKARKLTLRTSIIVGFPGETERDFEELLAFVEWARFDRLGAFAFSPEDDTPALALPDQVPEEVKQRRLDALMTLQRERSLSLNRQRVGGECQVLVEGTRREAGRTADVVYGRSSREAPEIDGQVLFAAPEGGISPGTFAQVRITGAREYDIVGELV